MISLDFLPHNPGCYLFKDGQGKVIYVGRRVLVEFDTNICGHNGNGIGADRKCWMVDWNKVRCF